MTVNIREAFAGKTIFFTGVTGFVGKVFLYKLLKEFPDVKKIYVLIRTKKGQAPLDRFRKQVMTSECFTPLKKEIGEKEFNRRASKVEAVSGDMLLDRLGLSPEVYKTLEETVNYIFHIAATVNFQEVLDVAIKMNVLGVLRVLALAQRCKHLEAMVHTSTCYVNWNRDSHDVSIKEQVYPLPFEPETMVKSILAMHPNHIATETDVLLKKYRFPNTYTFTKSIAEQLLKRYRGSLPVSVVRPAIVGCSLKEPTPGWVDALTAAGAIILMCGVGVLRELLAEKSYIGDLVPVDFVCSTLIKTGFKTALTYKRAAAVSAGSGGSPVRSIERPPVATKSTAAVLLPAKGGDGASASSQITSSPGNVPTSDDTASSYSSVNSEALSESRSPSLMPFIFQSATSGTGNVFRWRIVHDSVKEYWGGDVKHPKSIGPIVVQFMNNKPLYNFRLYAYRILPFLVMQQLANMPPPVGSPKRQKMMKQYEKAISRTRMLNDSFVQFTTKEWIYESENSKFLDEELDADSLSRFDTDAYTIRWWTYCQLYSWGITRFIMKSANRDQPALPETATSVFMRAKM